MDRSLQGSLHKDELTVFSKISTALWADTEFAERSAVETLSASSLQNLTPERTLETASIALLKRARAAGTASNSFLNNEVLLKPFFRLSIEERYVLVALHLGRWTYTKLARILDTTTEGIEEIAWKARLKLGADKSYPTAPRNLASDCPEYNSKRPWTQKYLDDEYPSGRQRFFLQGHLLSCQSCNACFIRTQTLYYAIEKDLNMAVGSASLVDTLQSVLRTSALYNNPGNSHIMEGIAHFVKRPDVKWSLVGLAALLLGFLIKTVQMNHQ